MNIGQKLQHVLVMDAVDRALQGGAVAGFRVAVPLELLRVIVEYSGSLLDWCPQLANPETTSIDPNERSLVRFDHSAVSVLDFFGRDTRPFVAMSECEFTPGHAYEVTMRTTCPPGFHIAPMGFSRSSSVRSCVDIGVIASADAGEARIDQSSLFRLSTFLPGQWCAHDGVSCTTHFLTMTVDLSDANVKEGVLTYGVPASGATGRSSENKNDCTRVPMSSGSLRLLVNARPGTSAQIIDIMTIC